MLKAGGLTPGATRASAHELQRTQTLSTGGTRRCQDCGQEGRVNEGVAL